MNDYGVTGASVSVEELIKLPIHDVWSGITAIDRYGECSPECFYGAWLAKGGRCEARDRFADGFETYVTCTITAFEEPTRFGWDVYGDEELPLARWGYELRDLGAETLVRQTFTHGPGESGLRMGVGKHPDRAAEIIQGRLDE